MAPPQKRRPRLSRWLVVIGCIVMAFATLTTWLQRQALSTDAWVAATDQLLADDEVRSALAVFLVDELYNAVAVEDVVAEVLPDDLDGLAPVLASSIRQPATEAVDALLATDEAKETWRTLSREAHATTIAALNDEGSDALSTAGGVVSIDLGQLVEALAERIGLSGDRLEGLPEDAGVVVLFESGELEAGQDIVRIVERAATLLLALVFALFGAAIWFASDRRRALRNVGIGLIVVGFSVAFLRLAGIGAVTSGPPGTSEPARSVLDIGTTLLRQAALTQISLGLLLVTAAVLVGPTDVAARLRWFLSPALRYGAASVAVGGTALAVGFIWFRADGPAASWIVVLVFFAACLASVAWLQQVSLRENPRVTNGAEPPKSNPGLISGVIGMVAPAVIRTIPMDDVVEQLDVNAIADRLDLNALMQRLDMDALVDRLDVNAIADQLDLNALMQRLDMDALVDRLDVNAIADQLDLDALMKKIDMGQITAGVTQDVATSGLDLARRQLVRADAIVDGVTDRILRRQPGDRPVAPARLEEDAAPEAPDPDESGETRRRDVSGHYAGPVTRLLALVGDISLALASWGVFWAVTLFVVGAVTGIDVSLGSGGWVSQVLIVAWLLLYFWIPVGLFGRTPVMALVGLAVVRRDGGLVDGRHAFGRALFVPISAVIFVVGLIGIVVGKERRALYDLTGGTVEVYDWGSRDAEQPVTIRQQLSARVARRQALGAEAPPPT